MCNCAADNLVAPVVLGLAQRDLADAKSLSFGEHRQQSLLVAVEEHFLEHMALHRARAASQIAEAQAGDEAQQPMKGPLPQRLEPMPARGPRCRLRYRRLASAATSLPISTPSICKYAGNVRMTSPDGMLESGHQRGCLAEIACQGDDGDGLSRRRQRSSARSAAGCGPSST